MLKSQLLLLLQQEIRKHDFSHFIDQPPSIAQGGRGELNWFDYREAI